MASAVQKMILKGKIQGEGGVIYCRCKGCRDGDSMLTKQAGEVTEVEL
jgi:hypothetical protein